jgi:platelet-activating factor acetylhydrolase
MQRLLRICTCHLYIPTPMMPDGLNERDDVELESFDIADEEPDAPLTSNMSYTGPSPRWATHRYTRWHNVQSYLTSPPRPRISWKHAICMLIGLYVLYCLARGSPLFASRLPAYTGKYDVGTIDIEVPARDKRNMSDAVYKSNGKKAFEFESVLFSLYYPASKGAKSSKRHHRWISKPVSATAEGYARVARMNNFIVRPIFTAALWAIAGSIQIPAQVDVPLLPADENDDAKKLPLIVFSHGTASSRTDYTQLCGELAGKGYLVAAIEHRDGSGPASIIVKRDGSETPIYWFTDKELLSDPPMNITRLKKDQLAFRQAEIEEVFMIMQSANDGNGLAIFKSNTRNEGATVLTALDNRLDLKTMIISGHSYGATGAINALEYAPLRIPASGGIGYDPGKESGRLNANISVPLLVVHSNSWSAKRSIFFGRPHFDTVKEIVQGVLKRTGAGWFMTMLHTSHPSITDAPIIEPLILRWTTGATISVVDGLREYVRVTSEFVDFVRKGEKVDLLAEAVTHPQYYDDMRSKERKTKLPDDIEKYWQIHVAPEA